MKPVDYMEPGKMDYDLIEPGIRGLVRQMNAVPFIETVSSCEGHVGDFLFKGASPEAGFTFINGGHIAFDVLPSPKAEGFLGEVGELAKSRSFSSLKEVGMGEESVYMVNFDTTHVGGHVSDLVKKKGIEDSDDNEERVRKSFQVDTTAAGRRKWEYQDFWGEMEKIAKKYSEKE
jgi:hypothetical protein